MPEINHVQIFENRGEMMGASNPHPHCQIWATASIPEQPARELEAPAQVSAPSMEAACFATTSRWSKARRARVVCSNDGFVAMVPFWAVWPFEVLLCSRRHFGIVSGIQRRLKSRS